MGRQVLEEEETSAGTEGGGLARSRGAGRRGELRPARVPASSVRDEQRDGFSFRIVSRAVALKYSCI